MDFNRRQLERMCGRPKALIEEAQRAGVEIGRTFCSACSLRRDCLYWAQLDTLEKFAGRRIVIVAHEAAFLPMPFSGDLVMVDEDIATKAARAVETDPARLLDPDKWQGASYQPPDALQRELDTGSIPLESIARKVAEALARQGEELTALREAGVEAGHLEACAAHLRRTHEAVADEIAQAGKAGASERRLEGMVAALKRTELRTLAMLFADLRDEIGTGRAGTNATRLVRGRRKRVKDADGNEREERLDRYVVSRPRRHGFGKKS